MTEPASSARSAGLQVLRTARTGHGSEHPGGALRASRIVAALVAAGALSGCSQDVAGPDAGEGPDRAQSQQSSPGLVEGGADTSAPRAEQAGADTHELHGEDNTPAGPEPFDVTLDVEEGTITAVEFTPGATNSESHRFQRIFAQRITDKVVGRTLEEAAVARVAGASLASDSFNELLAGLVTDESSG